MPRFPPTFLLAIAAALGCRNATESAQPPLLITCANQVTVAVTAGTVPSFSWSPRCGATYLEVTSPDGLNVYWVMRADTGRFAPPVRYAEVPPAMRNVFEPVALRSGMTYKVRLGLIVEEDSFALIGEKEFVY